MEQNEEITAKFIDQEEFRNLVGRVLLKQVYEQIRAEPQLRELDAAIAEVELGLRKIVEPVLIVELGLRKIVEPVLILVIHPIFLNM